MTQIMIFNRSTVAGLLSRWALLTPLGVVITFTCACLLTFTSCEKAANLDQENVSIAGAQLAALEAKIDQDGYLSDEEIRTKNPATNKMKVELSSPLMPTVDSINKVILSSTGNVIARVGDQPSGFGSSFIWDRRSKQLLLVAYINAGDLAGMKIDGLKAGDKFRITAGEGVASFSDARGSSLPSMVGLLAQGDNVGLLPVSIPGAELIINRGDNYARSYYKQSALSGKLRNVWGIDPGSGQPARQEGGAIACMTLSPDAYYSGSSDHPERWIKSPGSPRDDAHRPNHVTHGFFVMNPMEQGAYTNNNRIINGSGYVRILAWDHKFQDNAGYYKIIIHITKG